MKDLFCWQSKFESCAYSEKLINKIILLNEQTSNKVDLHEIKKSIYYAKKYHADQKRDSGEPYYTHPLLVAEMIADYVFKTDILVTSILHDTIEDTNLTKDMLEYIFDANISNKVESLTRIKVDRKISSIETIELLWLKGNIDLLFIKLFDRIHNLQTIDAKPAEKQKETILESAQHFMVLAVYFNIENILLKILTKKLHLFLDPLQLKYCQKTFDYNFQFFSLDFQNETN